MERKETESQRFDYEHRSGPTKPNPIIKAPDEQIGQVVNGVHCCRKHKTQRELKETQDALELNADRVQHLTVLLTAALPAVRHCYKQDLFIPKDSDIHPRFNSTDESVCLYTLYREMIDVLGLEEPAQQKAQKTSMSEFDEKLFLPGGYVAICDVTPSGPGPLMRFTESSDDAAIKFAQRWIDETKNKPECTVYKATAKSTLLNPDFAAIANLKKQST